MKPSRFTEEQIIGVLREQETGAPTADVCRKHGISSATFYKREVRELRQTGISNGVKATKAYVGASQLADCSRDWLVTPKAVKFADQQRNVGFVDHAGQQASLP